jgi:uncharacterized membrane protein
MRETISELFNNFAGLIIFLHVLSAIIWVGGMITIKFAVHNSIADIEKQEIKLNIVLKYLKNFFMIVTPAIALLIVTAVFMTIGFNFKGTPLNPIVHAKEALWLIMTALFIFISLKRGKAQMYFDAKDYKSAKETLALLSTFLIPANIILGIITLYLGITLRGF